MLLAETKRNNELTLDEQGTSPLEKCSSSSAEIGCTDYYAWRCPIFILEDANQIGLICTPTWEPRERSGVYLGYSLSHAGNVALVLNLSMVVSPQYHLGFDE